MGFFDALSKGLNKMNQNIYEMHYRENQRASTSQIKNELYEYDLWKRDVDKGKSMTNEKERALKTILAERGQEYTGSRY
jgi:hypothetical protein